MYRTFNCGIGMVGIVARRDAERVITALSAQDERAWLIGEVVEDAQPTVDALTVAVRPFSSSTALRMVVVLAWPPDPVTASASPTTTTTTTTLPEDGSTTTPPADDSTGDGG